MFETEDARIHNSSGEDNVFKKYEALHHKSRKWNEKASTKGLRKSMRLESVSLLKRYFLFLIDLSQKKRAHLFQVLILPEIF